MTAPALTAASSLAVLAIGGAANLVASHQPLQAKVWQRSGGFIGLVNGRVASNGVPAAGASAAQGETDKEETPATSGKKSYPIGGATGKPAPPSPFGRFRKHKPTKLPGPPKPYDASKSP